MSESNEAARAGFMTRAIELASHGIDVPGGGPFGAVIVRAGAIVAEAHNRVTELADPTAHAEVLAIRSACRQLGDFNLAECEIYASCEPCPMCLGAIYWARLSRLYFAASRADAQDIGFDDQRIYEELPRPIAERSLPTEQLLRQEAASAMARWKVTAPERRY